MNRTRRLQGSEFQRVRPFYQMTSFSISLAGNIRVLLSNKNNPEDKVIHWLNDEEKRTFVKSDYFKNARRYKLQEGQKKNTLKFTLPNELNSHVLDLDIAPSRKDIHIPRESPFYRNKY